jgi:CO/xanthine dehydrogenase Mo-binding subunit
MSRSWKPASSRCSVGEPTPRWDGARLVSGSAKYSADLSFPHMLWGKLLYAPSAPALIKRIDTSEAERSEGVVAVMTAADIPGFPYYCFMIPDMPILALDRVRYTGEAVAMVAAETEELAEQALHKIAVEYEPVEGVFDVVEAMSPDAPRVQDGKQNVIDHVVITRGDTGEGFKHAAVVVERTYRTPLIEHAFLETEAAVARFDDHGKLEVYSCSQGTHNDRRQIAAVLGVAESKVSVRLPPVGGGFGGKSELHVQPHAALMAWKTRRPVKVIRTREESFRAHVKRHPMIIRYKSGASRTGLLTAVEVTIIADTGPYANLGPQVVGFATELSTGPYDVPHALLEGYTVLTNNPICGAMRGFGLPQVTFACEQQMDMLADALGVDPLEIRLRNAIHKGSIMPVGATVCQPSGLRQVLNEAAQAAGWAARGQIEREPSPHLRRGVGVACCWQGFGLGANAPDYAAVQVEMASDGSVIVRCGAADMGQGLSNVVTQIVAEALNVPTESINLVSGDTDATLDCLPSVASRQTYVTGNAASNAVAQLRQQILRAAAQMWECSPEDLDLLDGDVVFYRGECSSPLADVVRFASGHNLAMHATGSAKMPTADLATVQFPYAHTYFSCGAQVAQVLVDVQTGRVEVERIVAAHDVGKAINPRGVLGQIEGGCLMGCGMALMEELLHSRDQCQTSSLAEYLVPTSSDVPEIVPIIVEVADPEGPYGAKGVGEQPVTPTAAAIANAVADAVGVRVCQLPISAERVLRTLWQQEEA